MTDAMSPAAGPGTRSGASGANDNPAQADTAVQPVIRLTGTSFRYSRDDSGTAAAPLPPTAPALSNIDLTVRPGETVMLCGQSGCGKTTVTRLLNGLIPGFFHGELAGSQTVCGLPGGTPVEAYVPLVGSVFQNPKTQYFNADTTSELAFPCENLGWPSQRIRERVDEVAERFGIEPLLDRSVFKLSGGQKQRLAVAAATMLHPRLVVMDEPTSNLDASAMRDLHDMVADLKASGVTVVIAEHRLAWCADLVDRYILFDGGAIAGEYSAAEFNAMPSARIESFGLRALDLAPYRAKLLAKSGERGQSHMDHSDHSASVEGPAPDSARNNAGARTISAAGKNEGTPCCIATRRLTVGYRRAFSRDIDDFEVRGGEITGLMGHNGAGKSTLVRTLCGLIRPISGSVLLHGEAARPAALTRAGFLVMQDVNYQLFADSVREELLLGLGEADEAIRDGAGSAGSGTTWSDAPTRFPGPTTFGKKADAVLRSLDLLQFADRHPMSLSGGQKQRLAIASALMCGKELIVLDEPTSGLDRAHMMQVGTLLRQLADSGKAVLVVTHDEELAALWCDRILDLDRAD